MNACDSGCWLGAGTARLSQLRHPAERKPKAASGETVTRETVTPTENFELEAPYDTTMGSGSSKTSHNPPRRPGETKKATCTKLLARLTLTSTRKQCWTGLDCTPFFSL